MLLSSVYRWSAGLDPSGQEHSTWTVALCLSYTGEMTIKRLDHISVVVEDLAAAIAFFSELGLEKEGEAAIEGEWVDRVNGLESVQVDIVMMRTPDGHGHLELTKFRNPKLVEIEPLIAPPNTLGLSLRFNHKGFATDVKLIAKLLAFAIFTVSGSRFDGRVAFRSARKAAFGPPGGPTAGFRRLRWRAQLRQKRRNYPMDPHRCQSTGIVASLPRQPQVRNAGARQP